MIKNNKGSLIVISGIDGSGKQTQLNLLYDKLKKDGYKVMTVDFPQYGKKSAGLVEEYLNGKYGSPDNVGPYGASIFYAVDRYDASFEMKKWLSSGGIILSNRYVSGNKGHQGGKISDLKERDKFFKWLDNLEYNIFGIPKEDINIFLKVDPKISQSLIDKKAKRQYTDKKRDIHEQNINHLQKSLESYEYIAKRDGWLIIDCVKENKILPKNIIHDMIYKEVKKYI